MSAESAETRRAFVEKREAELNTNTGTKGPSGARK